MPALGFPEPCRPQKNSLSLGQTERPRLDLVGLGQL